MQYLDPTEAKWWLESSTEKWQELLEPEEARSTTKEPGRVRRWWHSLRTVFGAPRSVLRSKERLAR
jgi:hypothetical protein